MGKSVQPEKNGERFCRSAVLPVIGVTTVGDIGDPEESDL
jgi:hypothetical protein